MGKIFILICVSGAWKHKNERMGGGPCSPLSAETVTILPVRLLCTL